MPLALSLLVPGVLEPYQAAPPSRSQVKSCNQLYHKSSCKFSASSYAILFNMVLYVKSFSVLAALSIGAGVTYLGITDHFMPLINNTPPAKPTLTPTSYPLPIDTPTETPQPLQTSHSVNTSQPVLPKPDRRYQPGPYANPGE